MFHRLAAMFRYHAVSSAVSQELSPIKLSVSVKGGAEAAVHAVRISICNKIESHDPNVIVIKSCHHT